MQKPQMGIQKRSVVEVLNFFPVRLTATRNCPKASSSSTDYHFTGSEGSSQNSVKSHELLPWGHLDFTAVSSLHPGLHVYPTSVEEQSRPIYVIKIGLLLSQFCEPATE